MTLLSDSREKPPAIRALLGVVLFAGLAGACGSEKPAPTGSASTSVEAASASSSAAVTTLAPSREATPPSMSGVVVRSGSALARTPDDGALVVADEDHHVLRVLSLPVDETKPSVALDMPGAPAQVLALGDRILVTIREPGLLLELRRDGTTLRETGRVALPWDAWGLAVTADGANAIVTSAWTHRITGIDLAHLGILWSLNATREPRGIAIGTDGVAYVGHLVGSRISKIEGIATSTPTLSRVDVNAAPLRTGPDELLDASLTYAPVLSPNGDLLFLPRHALGAFTSQWWFGAATVDTVTTKDFAPLSPKAAAGALCDAVGGGSGECDENAIAPDQGSAFISPRAAVYRSQTSTLLIASEGTNALVELDARALDPSLAVKRTHKLEKREGKEAPATDVVVSGGAPEAIALSADEKDCVCVLSQHLRSGYRPARRRFADTDGAPRRRFARRRGFARPAPLLRRRRRDDERWNELRGVPPGWA